ncbi:MAG: hypothetical protein ACI8TL_001345, partial [Natronomonas sp.]
MKRFGVWSACLIVPTGFAWGRAFETEFDSQHVHVSVSLIVPYDGSKLSRAALVRAVQFDEVLDQGVVVITAIPTNNTGYARDHGWLDDDEP